MYDPKSQLLSNFTLHFCTATFKVMTNLIQSFSLHVELRVMIYSLQINISLPGSSESPN